MKRQFTDAGLAAAVAGLTTDDVYRSSEFRERMLDSFTPAQLRVEAEASDRVSLYHLRTENSAGKQVCIMVKVVVVAAGGSSGGRRGWPLGSTHTVSSGHLGVPTITGEPA